MGMRIWRVRAGRCTGAIAGMVLMALCIPAAMGASGPAWSSIVETVLLAPDEGGRPLLPEGTTVDRLEYTVVGVEVAISLPEGFDVVRAGEAWVERVQEAFANAIDPGRLAGGIRIQARIGREGDYAPVELMVVGGHAASAEAAVRETAAPPLPGSEPAGGKLVTAGIAGPVAHGGQPSGALSGVVVYCSAGHGWTAGSSWYLQRPLLLDMVEDYGNIDQLNYLVHYLFNAGATVVPFRPVGYRSEEVVLDNDDPGVTYSGTWADSAATQEYYENGATVSGVPYRWAAAAPAQTATARYVPMIPVSGFWPVYCWARDGDDRVRQTYRIRHAGGVSSVVVDHRMVGKGWVWLGEYWLEAGNAGYVEITNASPDAGVVIADAIRFGNGMGDISRPGPGRPSGFPREEECSRYWAHSEAGNNAVGMNPGIWDGTGDDGSDNVGTAARWAAAMNRTTVNNERWRRIYVEYHTNAAGCSPPCSAKGTMCLVSSSAPTTYQTEYATILGNKIASDMHLIDHLFEYPWGSTVTPYSGAYGAISTYNNDNEFDATIVEVAFHDNVEDAANLLDPRVRNAVARSTLQGMVLFLSSLPGSAVPPVFLPDPPENVRAIQDASGNVVVSWSAPPTGDASGHAATGYRVYRSADGRAFDGGTAVGNVLAVTLSDVPPDTTTYVRVTATNAGGESMPSETLAVRVRGTPGPRVLIVSAFDRVDRTQDPTQTIPQGTMRRPILRKVNTFDYVIQHADALAAAGYGFDSTCNEAVAAGAVRLSDYPAVVWVCGEEGRRDKTFSSAEQNIVTGYLQGGGALFASGSEIGWELDGLGTGRTFYEDVLKADYERDSVGTYQVAGAPGGIFAEMGVFDFDPASGAPYPAESADGIAPRPGAVAALSYVGGSGGTAAVQYEGGGYRAIVLGFPFECITATEVRRELMRRAMQFLVIPPVEACSPVTIADFEDYPEGAAEVLFRKPRYSGTTDDHLAASPDASVVTAEVPGSDGGRCLKVQWAFLDAAPGRWLRLTTHNAIGVRNPAIWLDQAIRLRLRLDSGALRVSLGIRETNTYAPIGADGGTAGTIEFVGAESIVGQAPQGVLVEARPGQWQTILFKPAFQPVRAMTGDGVLTGFYQKGVLEHLALSAVDSPGPFTLYIDEVQQICRQGMGDFDYDGDVDVTDFGFFQSCFSGAGNALPRAECAEADFASDGDVSVSDFSVFQICFNGPGRPATENCPQP